MGWALTRYFTVLPKLSVTSKVSAPILHAWVGSRVHFRSSEDVNSVRIYFSDRL